MKITWKHVRSYEEAKDYFEIPYLHEWDNCPFYWGIVAGAKFGGSKRKSDPSDGNARSGPSYPHWIEGCLQHGGRLYFGRVGDKGEYELDQIEAFLIARYPSKMNKRISVAPNIQHIDHDGDVPQSILNRGKSAADCQGEQ